MAFVPVKLAVVPALPVNVSANSAPVSPMPPDEAISAAVPVTSSVPPRLIDAADRLAALATMVPGRSRAKPPSLMITVPLVLLTAPAMDRSCPSVRVSPPGAVNDPSVAMALVPVKLAVVPALPVSVPANSAPVSPMLPGEAISAAVPVTSNVPPMLIDTADRLAALATMVPGRSRAKPPSLMITVPLVLLIAPAIVRSCPSVRVSPPGALNDASVAMALLPVKLAVVPALPVNVPANSAPVSPMLARARDQRGGAGHVQRAADTDRRRG